MHDLKEASKAPSDNEQRTSWLVLHRVGAATMILATIALSAITLLSVMFTGGAALWDPNDLTTLQQWTSAIGRTAQSGIGLVICAALALAAIAAITVTAAWRRNMIWFIPGVVSGAILAGTLAVTSFVALDNLNSVIDHTHDRIGSVHVGTPDSSGLSSDDSSARPELTQANAEEAVRSMAATIEAISPSPLAAQDITTGLDAQVTAESLPLLVDSCTPDPYGNIGNQVSASFSLPSDDDGKLAASLVTAIRQSGYPTVSNVRSQVLLGDPRLALGRISVNDSYTVDGLIRITIVSNCASTSPTPSP